MGDCNDYKLPDPCLRLDTGDGSHWESIELGDGTGYIRLDKVEERDRLIRDMMLTLNFALKLKGPGSKYQAFYDRCEEMGVEL